MELAKENTVRQREWTDEQLADLFADVEFLKRTTKLSAKEICEKASKSKSLR
jgi:hypothetical protein